MMHPSREIEEITFLEGLEDIFCQVEGVYHFNEFERAMVDNVQERLSVLYKRVNYFEKEMNDGE